MDLTKLNFDQTQNFNSHLLEIFFNIVNSDNFDIAEKLDSDIRKQLLKLEICPTEFHLVDTENPETIISIIESQNFHIEKIIFNNTEFDFDNSDIEYSVYHTEFNTFIIDNTESVIYCQKYHNPLLKN